MAALVLQLPLRLLHRLLAAPADEQGQTSAEYALVLLGAAGIALLIALWAKDTDRIGKLLDSVMDSIIKLAK